MNDSRINLTFQGMVKRLSVQEGKRGGKKGERNFPFLGLTAAFALIVCVHRYTHAWGFVCYNLSTVNHRDSFLNLVVLQKFMKLFPSGLYTGMSSWVSSLSIRNYKIFIPPTELLSVVLIKTYQVSASTSVAYSSVEVLNLEREDFGSFERLWITSSLINMKHCVKVTWIKA